MTQTELKSTAAALTGNSVRAPRLKTRNVFTILIVCHKYFRLIAKSLVARFAAIALACGIGLREAECGVGADRQLGVCASLLLLHHS